METLDPLKNPTLAAAPFFVLTLLLELAAFKYLETDSDMRGYEKKDARTSLIMGIGSLAVQRCLQGRHAGRVRRDERLPRTVAPAGRHLVVVGAADRRPGPRVLPPAPLRAPGAHRLGGAPGASLQRVLQLLHGAAAEVESVGRGDLLGAVPAARLRAVDALRRLRLQPDLPVLPAHRAHRHDVAPDRARLQHALAPPRPPRQRPGVPRQELCGHLHHLGPDVRHVPEGAAPPDVRPDRPGQHLQRASSCSTARSSRCSGTSAAARAGATRSATSSCRRAGTRGRPVPRPSSLATSVEQAV